MTRQASEVVRKRAPKGIEKAADMARTLRLETMMSVRAIVDEVEGVCPPANWTLATYEELLFMDSYDC
jgi:glutamine synthetase